MSVIRRALAESVADLAGFRRSQARPQQETSERKGAVYVLSLAES
uniref:Uncharacterized protein n=1 Tax=uncultured bacterium A1Q1_fos_1807 TaxID=1256552 RepID=L7VS16_9BACT|nr:hypothetical protein [uncultured bacterium A1Q1_fos_1807]